MSDWSESWHARWIWYRPPPAARNAWGTIRDANTDSIGFLRRTLDLEAVPGRARCRVTADGRYILFVNGVELGRGPVRSEPAWLTYDEFDLPLRTGRNVIAVAARHYARPTVHWKPAQPVGRLGFGSLAFEAQIGDLRVGSDRTWRACTAPYTFDDDDAVDGPPACEMLDGRSFPWGWTDAPFDDRDWDDAIELTDVDVAPGDPFSLLSPRPIAHLSDRVVPLAPALLRDGERVTIDAGEILAAHPVLVVDARAGAVVDLSCGEDLDPDGRPVIEPRRWTMRYVAAGRGGERLESFEPVGFRYLEVGVRGGDARVGVSARERTYPRAPGASFQSSDTALNEIWAAGARSLDLCSFDAFIDCPGREQRAWLGDAYLTTLVRLVCDPDPALARWTLRLHAKGARADGLLPMVAAGDFGDRATTIPDHSLLWVLGLVRFVEYSGEHDLVEELLPVAARVLAWFERHRAESGLLVDMPGWIFIDWAQTERRAHIAAIDAMYAMALDAYEALCVLVDDHGSAERAHARAARTRAAFELYWDEARGAYVDAADRGGARGRRMSQQTNALAIVGGCAPTDRHPRILGRILDEDRLVRTATPGDAGSFDERMNRQWMKPDNFDDEADVVLAQPFFSHFLHRAVIQAGRKDLLLNLLRRWEPMVARGNGCLEEYWTAEPGLGSRCHVWSATPTYDLSTEVLGVRVRGGEVIVEPFLGDLEYARGAVATPVGFVRVSWSRDERWVELPPGARGAARIDGRAIALSEDRTVL